MEARGKDLAAINGLAARKAESPRRVGDESDAWQTSSASRKLHRFTKQLRAWQSIIISERSKVSGSWYALEHLMSRCKSFRAAQAYITAAVVALLPVLLCSAQYTKTARRYVADRVKVEPVIHRADGSGKQLITLKLKIEEGWFLLANPSGGDGLRDYQTEVTVSGKGLSSVVIDYPKGTEVADRAAGNWWKYERDVVIDITITRPERKKDPVELRLSYWPQELKYAGPPITTVINVP